MIITLRPVFSLALVLSSALCFAQAPNITYNSPQTFTTGTAISTVKPANTGGTVPAIAYSQLSTFAGTAGIRGNVNATGAAAQFNGVGALAADAAGNLFVIDFNNVIRKITTAGVVTTYAGTGAYGALNGPALQATFVNMNGIVVDANENLYVAEDGDNIIRKITPGGIVSTFAGKIGAYGYADGQDTSAVFANPYGLAVDKGGNVYVMDISNYLIRKITPGGLVSTLAGKQGVYGASDGPDTSATFSNPSSGVVDANGNLYITDLYKIRKISTDGIVTTIAGGINPGSADGIGTAASFGDLDAISIDSFGNIYVSDSGNSTIRKVTPDGTVTTIAGTPGVTGYADAIGAAAKFGNGTYSALGSPGNLFVSDGANSVIRKVNLTGFGIGRPLPTGLSFDGTTGYITGTPVAFSPATDYPVTAYNLSGQSTADVNITLTGTLSFPLIPAKIYGVADFSPAESTSGAINYTSSNTAVATVVSGNIRVVGAGTSTIMATNGNTTLSEVLTVNTAPLIVIADNKSKSVNAANPTLTITYDGFVNGDSASSFATQPTISTSATTNSLPGSYPINVSGNIDNNYAVTFVAGTLTITGGNVKTAAPELSYPPVLNYTSGVAITPVTPVNSGGQVPANAYAHITDFAGTPNPAPGYVDATGLAAKFLNPNGVALDVAGNAYIADEDNRVIRKITPAAVVTTLAGNGSTNIDKFSFPIGVAVDMAGNVYECEADGFIKKITPQGLVSIFAGGGNQLDGQGAQASFSFPVGITIDGNGNFYVADADNYLVRKITPSGLVSTIAGQKGVMGTADGKGTAATFSALNGITVDTNYNLYVIDGSLIRKITPEGSVTTLVGNVTGLVDIKGNPMSLNSPWGIVAEPDGIIYVAGHQQIYKITPGGVVSIVVGAYYPTGTAAQNSLGFSFLGGLAVDPSGNLYACDLGDNFVAKVSATGYSIDKTLPEGLVFDAATGKISGTPTVAFPPTFFTINAYNLGGESTSIIKLSVAASSVATLSALKLSTGSLSPAFTTAQTSYAASVPYATTNIILTPTSTSHSAIIQVDGIAVPSGTPSAPMALSVGANAITTVVTAQDSVTTKTYTVVVNRSAPSNNANLAGITVSKGLLSPAFGVSIINYADTVTNGTTSITVTATAALDVATITVNGTAVKSGTATTAIPLNVGSTTITISVTAQDGKSMKNYTIRVIRPSTNAKLSSLIISTGTLSPAFNANTTSYNTSITTPSITITPTAAVTGATIKVNGLTVASGSPSAAIALSVGANTITTVVTAQDGVTTDTYTLTVTRALSDNAGLSNITLSKGVLNPAFATATTSYTDMVTNGTASVTLTPTLADANATVTVNGTGVKSGSPSGAIALSVGSNAVTVIVTAEDGTTKNTYTVEVIRPSTNARLSALTISTGTLSPAFNTNTTSYTASETNATASITVTPTVAVTGATIKMNGITVASGTASGAITLAAGPNTITTVVTAQDGVTTDTYTLTVTRAANGNIPDASVSVDKPTGSPLLADDGIIVHQGISPNGDGINDFLQIDNLSRYPENHLKIMNRDGQLVFEAKGYDNATKVFDGHNNKTGQLQLPGTYFYSLDYTVKGIVKHKTGFLVLKY